MPAGSGSSGFPATRGGSFPGEIPGPPVGEPAQTANGGETCAVLSKLQRYNHINIGGLMRNALQHAGYVLALGLLPLWRWLADPLYGVGVGLALFGSVLGRHPVTCHGGLLTIPNNRRTGFILFWEGRVLRPWYCLGLGIGFLVMIGLPGGAHALSCSGTSIDSACCNNPATTCAEPVVGPWKYNIANNNTTTRFDSPDEARTKGGELILSSSNGQYCSYSNGPIEAFEEGSYTGYGGIGPILCENQTYNWHSIGWELSTEKTQTICANYVVTRCDTIHSTFNTALGLIRERSVVCPAGYGH
jgi:hypothetical protein